MFLNQRRVVTSRFAVFFDAAPFANLPRLEIAGVLWSLGVEAVEAQPVKACLGDFDGFRDNGLESVGVALIAPFSISGPCLFIGGQYHVRQAFQRFLNRDRIPLRCNGMIGCAM